MITHESLVKMQEVLEHCRQKGHTVHGGATRHNHYIMKCNLTENKDSTVDDMEKQNRYVDLR